VVLKPLGLFPNEPGPPLAIGCHQSAPRDLRYGQFRLRPERVAADNREDAFPMPNVGTLPLEAIRLAGAGLL
jgi:hypothetical protein